MLAKQVEQELALVPCLNVGIGTGTATVRDVRTKQTVRLTNVGRITLVNRVACVPLPVVRREKSQALVQVGAGVELWVRVAA